MASDVSVTKLVISAEAITIDCPECTTPHSDLKGDLRGQSFICDGCGKTIRIDSDVKLVFK